MTLALWSLLLSLLNRASASLIAERHRAGWLVALAFQLPWRGTTFGSVSSASQHLDGVAAPVTRP